MLVVGALQAYVERAGAYKRKLQDARREPVLVSGHRSTHTRVCSEKGRASDDQRLIDRPASTWTCVVTAIVQRDVATILRRQDRRQIRGQDDGEAPPDFVERTGRANLTRHSRIGGFRVDDASSR